MNNIFFRLLRKGRFLLAYLRAAVMGCLKSRDYSKIEKFCMFIGYPRSGHSLVAALLDAHPEIVMGMEWGVLQHMNAGYGRRQIFYSLTRNARLFRTREGNTWTGYSYRLEGQWQGKYDNIRIIGDKMGGRTSLLLADNPEMADRLTTTVGLPVKWIHVIRNPFDTITTMTLRMMEKRKGLSLNGTSGQLAFFIDSYFKRVGAVSEFIDAGKLDLLHVYHEDFIEDPGKELARIISFLGIEADNNYLKECEQIVYRKPHRSRNKLDWPAEMIEEVEKLMAEYDFLNRYSYDS